MKILYGLPSEGMGHATRSKVIISHLMKEHDVRIVTSDRAYTFMQTHFPGKVYKIKGFHLMYKQGSVAIGKTFSQILKNVPGDLIDNFQKYFQIQREFKADMVISDFESFAFFYAKYHGLPIISIDNMQVINRCRLDIPVPRSEKDSYLFAKNIIRAKVPNCNHYLITSFFNAKTIKKDTSLIPPILRNEIINAKKNIRDHILVYQTSTSQKEIISILKEVSDEIFHVYGFNKNERHANVKMKAFSEHGFIRDLVGAKAVITNGGFSLISECIYLHKPLCTVPIKNQFEQFVNAAYIEKCGYGRHFADLSSDAVKSFLYDLDKFQRNISKYKQNGNTETFNKLDKIITSRNP